MKKRLLVLAAIITILLSACEKKNENKSGSDIDDAPKLSIQDEEQLVEIPEGMINSEDQYATLCRAYIQTATNLSSFAYHLSPPENAQGLDDESQMGAADYSFSYSWRVDGQDVTMYWMAAEESENYTWDIDIEINGTRYDYLNAWESKNNSTGEIKFHNNWICAAYYQQDVDDCDKSYFLYSWNTTTDGTFIYEWAQTDEESEEYYFSYSLVSNPDLSGEVKIYGNGILSETYTWNADGSGSFTDELEDETYSWEAAL